MVLVKILTNPITYIAGAIVSVPAYLAPSDEDFFEYLLNPTLCACLFALFVTYFICNVVANVKNITISFTERKLAQWFLANGILIHFLYHGLSMFITTPALHNLKQLYDSRTPYDSITYMVYNADLYVFSVLNVFTYFALIFGSSYRLPLVTITATLSLFSMILSVSSEYFIHKFTHIHIDYDLTFTPTTLASFWIPLCLTTIWIAVSLFAVIYSSTRSASYVSAAQSNLIPTGKKSFAISSSVFKKGERPETFPTSPFAERAASPHVSSPYVQSPVHHSHATDRLQKYLPVPEQNDDNDTIDNSYNVTNVAELLEQEFQTMKNKENENEEVVFPPNSEITLIKESPILAQAEESFEYIPVIQPEIVEEVSVDEPVPVEEPVVEPIPVEEVPVVEEKSLAESLEEKETKPRPAPRRRSSRRLNP